MLEINVFHTLDAYNASSNKSVKTKIAKAKYKLIQKSELKCYYCFPLRCCFTALKNKKMEGDRSSMLMQHMYLNEKSTDLINNIGNIGICAAPRTHHAIQLLINAGKDLSKRTRAC